jgi:GNAT superfamily N-acetyltransferase
LARDVFGPTPQLNILVAEQEAGNHSNQIAGFISYFENYSSWEGKPGIHIGDLWVSQERRGLGVGLALLRHTPLSE